MKYPANVTEPRGDSPTEGQEHYVLQQSHYPRDEPSGPPFSAKWNPQSLTGSLGEDEKRDEFRQDLEALQSDLRNYNRLLAQIAGVEDLTDLEMRADAGNVPN